MCSCICVCECCLWQSVWLPGCSQAVSKPALPALRACSCVCMCVGFCVCTSSAMGHDSKEGFRTHGSELNRRPKGQIQLSTALLPLSFSLTILSSTLFFLAFICPSFSYCALYLSVYLHASTCVHLCQIKAPPLSHLCLITHDE